MKTAMQELRNDILIEVKLGFISQRSADRILNYIDGLYIEQEKQAIKEAWWDGFKLQRVVVDSNADETYFNQKYNNNEGTTLG